MSQKKPDPLQPTPAIEDGRPLTPARADGPTHTVIVAEELRDTGKTVSMLLPTTDRSLPAVPEAPPEVAVEVGVAALDTRPVDAGATRLTLPPVAEPTTTLPTLPPVTPQTTLSTLPSVEDVPAVVTRPTRVPRPLAPLIAVGAVVALLVFLGALRFATSEPEPDPSRPRPLVPRAALPAPAPPAPPPRAPVNADPPTPSPSVRAPLSLTLTLDAGNGAVETTVVPASVVRIETDPPTTISWNGERYGPQPALLTLPVGPNVITVENPELGLKKSVTITANPEERTFLRLEFARGWLSVDRPASAKVSVGGVPVRERAVQLWEGRHRVDVVFANGQRTSRSVDVVRGETAEVFIEEPPPAE